MSDQPTKDGVADTEGLDDLNRRLQMAENRLGAVRSHRLNRQHESLELLTKIEERFVQQRNELLHANDHIRRLEKLNRDLVNKLRRLITAVETGMDAADDIFYRMVNVTNEINNFSTQTITGEFQSFEALEGADIDAEPTQPAAPSAEPQRRAIPVVRQTKVEKDDSAQVLNIKQIFNKG